VSLQSWSRRDPQPVGTGWEVAFVAVSAVLLLLGLGALAGRGAAAAILGGGWVWPARGAFRTALGGLLTGRPAAGLAAAAAARLPGAVAVYAAVGVAELVSVALLAAGGIGWAGYSRPGDARGGMATRGEAAAVLGVGRLRSVRSIIRPDLYGPPGGGAR